VIFHLYSISDGHPYNGKTIGWCAVGMGKAWASAFKSTTEEKVLKKFPDAEFKEIGWIENDQDIEAAHATWKLIEQKQD